MRLILIRHGETASNVERLLDTAVPGAPLNATGEQQAESLVQTLAAEPIQAVHSSTIRRAVQTATPLARARELQVQQWPGLGEIAAGEEEMQPIPTARYVHTVNRWITGDDTAHVPGGDTRHSFLTRYDDALAGIAAAGHECVAVVSHGAAIRCWTGLRARNVTPEQATRTRLDNTTYLTFDGDPRTGWTLTSWGESGPDGVAPPQ